MSLNILLGILIFAINAYANVSPYIEIVDRSCHTERNIYHKTFCDLAPEADEIYIGRVIKVDSLSSEKNRISYSKQDFPFKDSIYDNFLEKYKNSETVRLRLKQNVEQAFKNNKWEKVNFEQNVEVAEIRGWLWNWIKLPVPHYPPTTISLYNSNSFNHYRPTDWNDALRVFFIKKKFHGDSLIGISKTYQKIKDISTECQKRDPSIEEVYECMNFHTINERKKCLSDFSKSRDETAILKSWPAYRQNESYKKNTPVNYTSVRKTS